jgi:hypothetical protein
VGPKRELVLAERWRSEQLGDLLEFCWRSEQLGDHLE